MCITIYYYNMEDLNTENNNLNINMETDSNINNVINAIQHDQQQANKTRWIPKKEAHEEQQPTDKKSRAGAQKERPPLEDWNANIKYTT